MVSNIKWGNQRKNDVEWVWDEDLESVGVSSENEVRRDAGDAGTTGVHDAAPERLIHEKPTKPKILHAAMQPKCYRPDASIFEKLMSKSTTEDGASGAAPLN